MFQYTLITLEYNSYNGIIFNILYVSNNKLDNSLFGISVSRRFLYVDILFRTFKVFDTGKY